VIESTSLFCSYRGQLKIEDSMLHEKRRKTRGKKVTWVSTTTESTALGEHLTYFFVWFVAFLFPKNRITSVQMDEKRQEYIAILLLIAKST